ncbi:hypothetical protein K474DRAFT_1711624 [Panus rudis PR-1116 ss-1]|nr:hypothetical protein K474DRAFT_1711624 [Panus rudis PR-1116 ss-1]
MHLTPKLDIHIELLRASRAAVSNVPTGGGVRINKLTRTYYLQCLQNPLFRQTRPFSSNGGWTNDPHPGKSPTTELQPARSRKDKDNAESSPEAPFPLNLGPAAAFTAGSSVFGIAVSTLIGLGIVFFGGVAYASWYKKNVLDKIETAFSAGYEPALELANHSTPRDPDIPQGLDCDMEEPWIRHLPRREDQDRINRIVHGKEVGHYFLILGPKGTGKTTMFFDAMRAFFRLRLGKTLNYHYNEDSVTGLFQRSDPREGGPALDIERAMDQVEKVAAKHARRIGKPLVMIINNVHLFKNNDEGRNLILQLQQRAEAWAAVGILTLVFSSDDFWPFRVLRRNGTRMRVHSVDDLNFHESMHALEDMRMDSRRPHEDHETLETVVSTVGGRLSNLAKAAKRTDIVRYTKRLFHVEKAWLLSQIGLIGDLDGDVQGQQKWSLCSWLLLREFVKVRQEQEQEKEIQEATSAGEKNDIDLRELPLPKIPYHKCCQIMKRPDFLEELDRLNIIAIDINHDVRPDSMLLLNAAREVVEEEGFDKVLGDVADRLKEIGSLQRTRELSFKDVKDGNRYG